MFGNLLNWLDHRTGYRKLMSAMLLEHIPGGAKWRYVWGSTLAFVFAIQLITGVLLMLHYSPGDTTAWSSVYFIQYEMDFGWLIRGLHHFGSQTMVVLLAVHMLQVVIAGAQLPPREFNWWIGLGLMGIVLGLSLTGYLLPWDQKGFYATQVATNIASNVPIVGEYLQRVVVGGPEYGNHTLTQFFTLHVGVLPPLLIVLVIAHLYVFRRHGVTAPAHAKGMDYFWPAQAFRDLLACMVIFGVMVSIVIFGQQGNKIETGLDPTRDHLGIELDFAGSKVKVTKVEKGPAEQAGVKVDDLIVQLDSDRIGDRTSYLEAVASHQPGQEATLKVKRGKETLDLKVTFDKLSLYKDWARAGRKGFGANLDAPADRRNDYPARPEWYFLFLFQILKYFKGDMFLVGALHIPNGVMLLLFLLPLLGYGRMRKFGHAVGIIVVVALLGAVAGLTFKAIVDDSPEPILGVEPADVKVAEGFRHRLKLADEESKRAVQLAHFGIPAEGPLDLLHNDPSKKGPKLFQTNCAGCHSHPNEIVDPESKQKLKKTASDLSGFGSVAWIRGLLQNPSDDKYFGLAKKKVKDEEGKEFDAQPGGMIKWRARIDKRRKGMDDKQKEEQDKQFDLISQFLADQSYPKHLRDKELHAKAFDIFQEECMKCHGFGGKGDRSAPDLTDYGSADWIRQMLMWPNGPNRHFRLNLMPAFRPKAGPAAEVPFLEFETSLKKYNETANPKTEVVEMSDIDREILIRWLTNDYRVVFGGQVISGPALGKHSK